MKHAILTDVTQRHFDGHVFVLAFCKLIYINKTIEITLTSW